MFRALTSTLILILASALSAPAQQTFDLSESEITLFLPEGWVKADAWSPRYSQDALTSGDMTLQVLWEKRIKTDSQGRDWGEETKDRATLLLRVSKGAKPFSTDMNSMARMRSSYRKMIEKSLNEKAENPPTIKSIDVVKRTLAENEPALEIQFQGERDGKVFHQHVLTFTGAHFSYVLRFEALDANWNRWKPEWDDIIAKIELAAPYQGRSQFLSPEIALIIIAGILMSGWFFKMKRSKTDTP